MLKILESKKLVMMLTHYATMILGVSLTDVKEIFAIACFAISLLIGLFNLIMLIVKAARDGKIDKEELAEIIAQIKEIQQTIEKEGNLKDEKCGQSKEITDTNDRAA